MSELRLSEKAIDVLSKLSDDLMQTENMLREHLIAALSEESMAYRTRTRSTNRHVVSTGMNELMEMREFIERLDKITGRIANAARPADVTYLEWMRDLMDYKSKYPLVKSYDNVRDALDKSPIQAELPALLKELEAKTGHVAKVSRPLRGFIKGE